MITKTSMPLLQGCAKDPVTLGVNPEQLQVPQGPAKAHNIIRIMRMPLRLPDTNLAHTSLALSMCIA